MNNKNIPSKKLLNTPATIIDNFWKNPLSVNLVFLGTFLPSGSSSVSPASITYPPSGIAFIIYSVSSFFLLKENNLGPNPNENS